MSEVAAPEWARLTGKDLGSGQRPSRGRKKKEKRNFLFLAADAKGFAVGRKTFGKPAHGFCAKTCQIERRHRSGVSRMTKGTLWLFSIAQGLGMLALNVGLRVLVS